MHPSLQKSTLTSKPEYGNQLLVGLHVIILSNIDLLSRQPPHQLSCSLISATNYSPSRLHSAVQSVHFTVHPLPLVAAGPHSHCVRERADLPADKTAASLLHFEAC